MPKHGWKWRTEQVQRMDVYELRDFLIFGKCSAKLAKWIYLRSDPSFPDVEALRCIANSNVPWARPYVIRELEKHKADEFGDWVIVALGTGMSSRPEDAELYLATYDDESAHTMTRGSAIFGLNNVIQVVACRIMDGGTNPLSDATMARIRDACHRAIHDKDNPYARAGACRLGERLGGFEEELRPLKDDHTPIGPHDSLTVAIHYEEPDPDRQRWS